MTEPLTRISAFLRACISPAPDRDAVASVHDWFALRSHPGLVRAENEDRVVVARWTERGEACWVIGVADGIGSGKAGAEAASIALAWFVAALIDSRQELDLRLAKATELANRAVFERWRGKEGTTLSAVMVRGQRRRLVNVGDSRIYGIDREDQTVLLTQDDTMPTIPGLLQFVGMGTDLAPHIHDVAPRFVRVLLTSDGAHNYVDALFTHLVRAAKGDMRMFIDRLTHLATWCGGGDNATTAIASLTVGALESAPDVDMDVWTPGMHHTLRDEPSSPPPREPRTEGRRPRREHLDPPRRDNHRPAKVRPDEALGEVSIQFSDDDPPRRDNHRSAKVRPDEALGEVMIQVSNDEAPVSASDPEEHREPPSVTSSVA